MKRLHLGIKYILALSLSLALVACNTMSSKNDIDDRIIVSMSVNSNSNLIYVKKTDLFNSCINNEFRGSGDTSEYFVGVSCTFKNPIPQDIEIQYLVGLSNKESIRKYYGKEIMESKKVNGIETRFYYIDINGNKLSESEWIKRGLDNRNKAIMSLPPSAWKSYTIDVQSIVSKYKNVEPKGKPTLGVVPIGLGAVIGSPFGSLHNRHLKLEVVIDNQGNVTLKENYTWENPVPANPYS